MIKRNRSVKPFKGATWDGERWKGTPPFKKPGTAIKKVSYKMSAKKRIYAQERRWFLSLPENAFCPVAAAGLIGNGEYPLEDKVPHHRATTQIHHLAGRIGKNFLDQSTWLAVSGPGHDWIHNHPLEARKKGWIFSR